MSKQDKPLPCPFCGHIGLAFSEGSTFRWVAYSCGGCGMGSETRIQTMGEGTNEEWRAQAERDAIKEWNTRAAPPVAEPVATITECEACFTPDVCRLRGTCDYYDAKKVRVVALATDEELADCGLLSELEPPPAQPAQRAEPVPLTDEQKAILRIVLTHYLGDPRVDCLRPLAAATQGSKP